MLKKESMTYDQIKSSAVELMRYGRSKPAKFARTVTTSFYEEPRTASWVRSEC